MHGVVGRRRDGVGRGTREDYWEGAPGTWSFRSGVTSAFFRSHEVALPFVDTCLRKSASALLSSPTAPSTGKQQNYITHVSSLIRTSYYNM